MRTIKFLIKYIYNTILNFVYYLIIKTSLKGKKTLPSKLPFIAYEIFTNLNKHKLFDNKIILPYNEIDNFNKININRPNEVLEIKVIKPKKTFKVNLIKTRDVILPLALLDKRQLNQNKNDKIKLSYNGKNILVELKYKNRFHYLPISCSKSFNEIEIKANNYPISIAKPIYRDQLEQNNKPKLIVHIFIDALPQSIIEKFGYDIMPNTQKYFLNGGTVYSNAFAQSEWTLSSIAGVFTGKYTRDHMIYHPRKNQKIANETLADKLTDEGYLTFACSNVPKLTPLNGFDKGFNRFIMSVDQDCNYIIDQACEQLDSFGGDQYMFLSFFDIHESHKLQPVSSQVSNKIEDFQYKEILGNSKDTRVLFDNERINMCKRSITHFDKKIKRLYDKIDEYTTDSIVIVHSDHGVNFMTKTSELLGKERQKVLFMYKNGVETSVNNNIKEIREIPNMVINDLGINNYFKYYNENIAISESLYPNKDYEISLRTNKHVLFFKVNWRFVKNKDYEKYKYSYSFHLLNEEEKKLEINESNKNDFNMILKNAKNHYKKMCINLTFKNR